MKLITLIPCAFLLYGCAGQSFMQTITPETVAFGVTDQNLFNGPIYGTPPKGQSRPNDNHFGAIGGTMTFTYRLKPLRIQRQDLPPRATPFPHGEGEAP